MYSPIADVMLPLPWFSGRVGILGDAAHACAPHLTQGAGMALEDGLVLAWIGPPPVFGATEAGIIVELTGMTGRRDGSGNAVTRPLSILGTTYTN